MCVQIHDELVFEVRQEVLPAACKVIKQVMESVQARWQLAVPFPVKLRVGPNWGMLEPYLV